MTKLLCPHCLQPLDGGYRGECPHCGRSLENRNPEGALPLGTQLGGRYTVGTYLSADGDGLAYRGVLNDEKKFVLIKEYFPVTLCNGRSADGALMPKEEKEVLFKTSRMDFKDLYDDLKNLTPATGLSTILDVMEENNTVYAVEESEKGMTLSHYLHLRSRTLTPAEARTLLQPIMEGVALLHKSGLIHRGICPVENTLYVSFNGIANRSTEYFVAGGDSMTVTGYATTEASSEKYMYFKIAFWELSDDKTMTSYVPDSTIYYCADGADYQYNVTGLTAGKQYKITISYDNGNKYYVTGGLKVEGLGSTELNTYGDDTTTG